MGIGDKLLNGGYSPGTEGQPVIDVPYLAINTIRCPIKFTDDIIEYVESPEYLDMTLRPLQKKFLEELFSRKGTGEYNYDSGVMCCGMRGGKSWTAAMITTFMTQFMLQFDNPAKELGQAPGTRLTAQCIASSEVQSKETAYAAVESIIDYSVYWQKYLAYLEDLELTSGKYTQYQYLKLAREFGAKNIAILSLHSNSAALAGKTSYCVVLDELSRFDVIEGAVQTKSQKRTADAVYNTVSRAASSLKQISKVVTISSPMFEDDYTMKLLCMALECHVGEQSRVINALRDKETIKAPALYGMHATTFELNPKSDVNPTGFVKGEDFESDRIQNPETYNRDYLAVPPSTVNPFFEFPERIDRVVMQKVAVVGFVDKVIEEMVETDEGFVQRMYMGKTVTPFRQDKMKKYHICVDQGETSDHFALAMGHIEDVPVESSDKKTSASQDGKISQSIRLKVVIDVLEGWVPDKANRITVSFANVEEAIKILCASFNVGKVTYDTYSSVESIQRLFSAGINTVKLGANKEMYDVLKQLVYQGQVEVPPHPLIIKELKQLSLIRGKKVDHPPKGSKDYADAVCRVVWCCYEDYIQQTIHGDHMLPYKHTLPTLRSMASAHDIMSQSENNPHSALWEHGSAPQSLSGYGVFGETVIVRQNIMPNITKK